MSDGAFALCPRWVVGREKRASPERHHGTCSCRLDSSVTKREIWRRIRRRLPDYWSSRGPHFGPLRLRALKSATNSVVASASLKVRPRICARMRPILSKIGPDASRRDANRLRIFRKSGIGRVSILNRKACSGQLGPGVNDFSLSSWQDIGMDSRSRTRPRSLCGRFWTENAQKLAFV